MYGVPHATSLFCVTAVRQRSQLVQSPTTRPSYAEENAQRVGRAQLSRSP